MLYTSLQTIVTYNIDIKTIWEIISIISASIFMSISLYWIYERLVLKKIVKDRFAEILPPMI